SLGALLLPIPELLPVLVPLNIFQSGYLTWRYRRRIHLPTLFGMILPLMAAGTLIGYLLRPALEGALLKTLFGVLVLWFALRELWRMRRGGATGHGPAVTRALMLAAGASHGLFASGGPLLVYGLAGTRLDKAALRATLMAVWLSLNGLLSVILLLDGSLVSALPRLATYLPAVLVGLAAGGWLHRRIDERRFRQLVFALLAVTGLLLAWPG